MKHALALLAVLLFAALATLSTAQDLPLVPHPKITAAMQSLVDDHIPGTAVMLVATKDRGVVPPMPWVGRI